MTAWTQRPEDEHRLLSSLLACFLRHEALPEDLLTGPLAELGLSVPLTIALPPPEDRSFADVWSALGGELKPSLDIVVSAPTWTGRVYPAAPHIQAPPEVSMGGVDDDWPPRELSRSAERRRQANGHERAAEHAAAQGPQEVPMTSGADEQLLARLQDVEARVRLAVDHRRADDPSPDDPFRGLYVNDETVERLLGGPRADAGLRRRPPGRRRPGPADDAGPQRRRSRRFDAAAAGDRRWCPTWTAGSSGSTATSTTT